MISRGVVSRPAIARLDCDCECLPVLPHADRTLEWRLGLRPLLETLDMMSECCEDSGPPCYCADEENDCVGA